MLEIIKEIITGVFMLTGMILTPWAIKRFNTMGAAIKDYSIKQDLTISKITTVEKHMNGMKDDLVIKAEELGEARGKILGRDEVLRDIADEKPFVIFLDDNREDLDLIATELARVGIKKYMMYTDYSVFLNNLSRICSVYIIDKGLPGSSGLAMINQIMARNPNNFIILLTGDMEPESQRACQNAGATKTVIKNSNSSYLNELCRFIDEGITAVRLRR